MFGSVTALKSRGEVSKRRRKGRSGEEEKQRTPLERSPRSVAPDVLQEKAS